MEAAPVRRGVEHKLVNPEAPSVAATGEGGRPTKAARAVGTAPTVGTSFLAAQLAESNFVPPDTMGSVGPSQILVHVNGRVKVFDKSGNLGALNATDASFWDSVRNGQDVSDPEVEYDRLSGRWFITAINLPPSGPDRILIAVSSGSTISSTSSFTFFQFQHDLVGPTPNADTSGFADYDTLGVDKFALYIGVNVFDTSGFFTGTTGFVVRKANLLSGTLTVTAFRQMATATISGPGPLSPQGVQNQDPGATQGYFIGVDSVEFSKLDIRRISDPGGTPSISGNLALTVPTTTFPIEVPQPSPGPNLDALDDRLFAATIAREPDGQLTLWTAHNIQVNASGVGSDTGGRDGSRWYEIGSLTTTPTLVQSGTLFDSATTTPLSFWIPSIAASGQGHAVIGTSRAGASATSGFANVDVADRLAGDALGTLRVPTLATSSTSLYDTSLPGTERWGDYSQTVIDPNDNMTFWTFQEYANATNSWGVQVVQIRAPPPATPSSASPASIPAGKPSVSVVITGTSIDGSGFFDPGPDPGGPGFANHISAAVGGGVTVNSVTYSSPTSVTLDISTVGAVSGAKDVTIVNPDGQSATGAGILSVEAPPPPPTITSFLPTSGPVGTSVTITGTNFTGATSVKFFDNVSAAAFAVDSSTQITTTVPAGASTGPISVTTPAGTATSADSFTVTVPPSPTITSFLPTSGPVGTSVTITGTDFTGATSVKFFDNVSATFTDSSTQITATVPLGASTGPISVTTSGGTATSSTDFTVTPTITSFSPMSGPVGTSVTITGTSFTGVTFVKFFDNVSATFTVNSSTQITATVPLGASTGPISVTTPGETAISSTDFTVTAPGGGGGGGGGAPPPPTITSFSPTSGPVGTSVTFTGTDFTGTTAVSFGGVASTNFTVNSSAQIKATVPAGAMTGAITVVTPSGTAVSSANFTVLRSSHDRSLSLMLRKHLIARGTVTVGDGIAACYQRVPVKIQRKLAGDWRTIASTLTGSTGLFREPIPDRAGTYRAVASRVVLANDICRRAVSAVMVNR